MIFVNEERESKWGLGTVFVCADNACEKQINVVEHDNLEKMVGSKEKVRTEDQKCKGMDTD